MGNPVFSSLPHLNLSKFPVTQAISTLDMPKHVRRYMWHLYSYHDIGEVLDQLFIINIFIIIIFDGGILSMMDSHHCHHKQDTNMVGKYWVIMMMLIQCCGGRRPRVIYWPNPIWWCWWWWWWRWWWCWRRNEWQCVQELLKFKPSFPQIIMT